MANVAEKTKPTAPETEVVDPKTGEVTTTRSGPVAVPDEYAGYVEDSGSGFENQTSEDVAIPFISLLQPGSPEVQGEEAVAKAGMLINKTTGDVISGKEGVSFVPAYTEHLMVEWTPREKGGGIVARHAIDSDLAKRVRETQPFGEYKTESGNDLVETYYCYGVALDAEANGYPAVLSFSSTMIRAYKGWMFRARSVVVALPDGRKLTKLPLFSHGYRLRTERQEKNGHTWYTPVIGFAGENAEASRLPPSSDLYQMAKGVKEAISSGMARAATESLRREEGTDRAPAKGSPDAKDAPY